MACTSGLGTVKGCRRMRLLYPLPTKRKVWAESAVDVWQPFFVTPSPQKFGDFLVWLWHLVSTVDVATLYLSMVRVWMSLAPATSRGASRCTFKARLLAVVHVALSSARLLAARQKHRWPKWFSSTWKTLTPECMHGISTLSFDWFLATVRLVNGQVRGSSVYILQGYTSARQIIIV